MTDTPATLPAEERLPVLDIVRGVALLGILVMNVPGFSHSLFSSPEASELWSDALNRVAAALRIGLFAGKFNSMFGLLFGIGFALQFGRLQARAPGRASLIYLRRLAVLLALGLVHAGLLWSGDVLLVYALLGLVLLLVQRLPDRTLLGLIVLCLLYPTVAVWLRPLMLSPQAEALAAFDYQDLLASNNLAFGEGSFFDAARETLRVFGWATGSAMGRYSYASFYAHMASALFIGYWIGRRGWLQRLDGLMPQLRRVQAAALTLAIVCAALQVASRPWLQGHAAELVEVLASLCETLGRLGLTLFYVTTLVRLSRRPGWRSWLAPFAAAGRMPLSNYLLQTAMGTFIFYGWGLGLWGQLGPFAEIVLALTLFVAVQLPLSCWWLSRWRYGPFEWAWRVLTYGVVEPLRRRPA